MNINKRDRRSALAVVEHTFSLERVGIERGCAPEVPEGGR